MSCLPRSTCIIERAVERIVNKIPEEFASASDVQLVKNYLHAIVKEEFRFVVIDPDELYRSSVNQLRSRGSARKSNESMKESLVAIAKELTRERTSQQLRARSQPTKAYSESHDCIDMREIKDYVTTSGDAELIKFFGKVCLLDKDRRQDG